MMAPIVDELAKELDGKAKVFKVDIDQEEALATKFGIMSIPTFMVVKNGKITAQEPGGRSKEDLKAMLAL